MNTTPAKKFRLIQAVFSVIVIIAFFVPWVSWEKKTISGADMPKGDFFRISHESFGLSNPFPQFDGAMILLWLIPAFAVIALALTLFKKSSSLAACVTGILALSLVTMYILFTNVLSDLGATYKYEIGIFLTIFAGTGIILASSANWPVKISLLLLGPLVTYLGFTAASSHLENQKFDDTANTSSAYTVNALDLIREFQANDSLANAKYREQIVTVNGSISAIERPNDSTVNIKFIDTTGSYIIFPFHGETLGDVKELKEGDPVSLKGSCSGGVLSEILGTESITFKRSSVNKK